MAEDKAMAIVGASLQITPQDLAELLTSLDLLDTPHCRNSSASQRHGGGGHRG